MGRDTEFPVEIVHADCAEVDDEKLLIRLAGRRVDLEGRIEGRALLVVDAEGRRHRFPEIARNRRDQPASPTEWAASFAVPLRLERALGDQTSVVIGTATTPLPELRRLEGPAREVAADDAPATPAATPTVAALKAELKERGATEARLRASLASALAELEASATGRQRLETTHAKLREELGHLRAAVEEEGPALRQELDDATAETTKLSNELGQLRAELATATVAREAALAESAGLRAELERAAAELVQARRVSSPGDDEELDEAELLLAEARALTQRLGRRTSNRPAGSGAAV